jgi:hypothetical protein
MLICRKTAAYFGTPLILDKAAEKIYILCFPPCCVPVYQKAQNVESAYQLAILLYQSNKRTLLFYRLPQSPVLEFLVKNLGLAP